LFVTQQHNATKYDILFHQTPHQSALHHTTLLRCAPHRTAPHRTAPKSVIFRLLTCPSRTGEFRIEAVLFTASYRSGRTAIYRGGGPLPLHIPLCTASERTEPFITPFRTNSPARFTTSHRTAPYSTSIGWTGPGAGLLLTCRIVLT
jgi:hypothetical protein